MHELAERLLLSRSATTRFADRLEREKLVERHQVHAELSRVIRRDERIARHAAKAEGTSQRDDLTTDVP